MSNLITIFGGSGFVGRYIARRMAKAGWRVRVAVRRTGAARFLKDFGKADQVEVVQCNIRDDTSVASALDGAEAVVNCVGILAEDGDNRFDSVQAEGAARIARLAAEAGITRMVQISAIGADMDAESEYSATKGEGEAAVLKHMPEAVILRPSIVFGKEDQFFNRFSAMTKISPFLPVIGGATRFQPVYVDDVAAAAEHALTSEAASGGIYELGGPEIESFRALMERLLRVTGRRRIILDVPFFAARPMAWAFDMLTKISFGMIKNPVVTRDQLRNLARDNVVSAGAESFAAFNITPTAMDDVLPSYLGVGKS